MVKERDAGRTRLLGVSNVSLRGDLSPRSGSPCRRSRPAAVRGAGVPRVPHLRHPGPRLRPPALRHLCPGAAGSLFLQGARRLSELRPAHDRARRPPRGRRAAPRPGAVVGPQPALPAALSARLGPPPLPRRPQCLCPGAPGLLSPPSPPARRPGWPHWHAHRHPALPPPHSSGGSDRLARSKPGDPLQLIQPSVHFSSAQPRSRRRGTPTWRFRQSRQTDCTPDRQGHRLPAGSLAAPPWSGRHSLTAAPDFSLPDLALLQVDRRLS